MLVVAHRSRPMAGCTEVIYDETLSLLAIGLINDIRSREDGWQTSIDEMAEKAGKERPGRAESRRKIRGGLRELEAAGYLRRQRTSGPAGRPVVGLHYFDIPRVPPLWRVPNRWTRFLEERKGNCGCGHNPSVPLDRCCAFHYWTGLVTHLRPDRTEGQIRADIAIYCESVTLVSDPAYGDASHDAAASFIAHALGESGCGEPCDCPAADRARAFAGLLPAVVAHLWAAEDGRAEDGHEGNSHERCPRCPAGLPPLPPPDRFDDEDGES